MIYWYKNDNIRIHGIEVAHCFTDVQFFFILIPENMLKMLKILKIQIGLQKMPIWRSCSALWWQVLLYLLTGVIIICCIVKMFLFIQEVAWVIWLSYL